MKKIISFLSLATITVGLSAGLFLGNPTEAKAWGMAPGLTNPYIPSVSITTESYLFAGSYPQYIVSGNNTVLYLTSVVRLGPTNFLCYYKSAPVLPQ